MDTTTAYMETFGCLGETEDGHDHPGECRWGFTCNICRRPVDETPCPQHAPLATPGLVLVDCDANPRHYTWILAHDGYPAPCMPCQLDAAAAAHSGCEHSHHKAWRRWRLTRKLAGWGYSMGFIRAWGVSYGGGCNQCVTRLRWGRSSYLLGWDNWRWHTLISCLRAGHWPADTDACSDLSGTGFCVKCAPCPGCWHCNPATYPAGGPYFIEGSFEPPHPPYQLPDGPP